MNCKNLVKRVGYLYCKHFKKQITLPECKLCHYIERTTPKVYQYTIKNKSVLKRVKTPLKQVSKKRQKMEKERYSIFTNDLEHCYICGKQKNDIHEILSGAKRTISMKNGFCIPICRLCHTDIQNNNTKMLILKKKCQSLYETNHTREEWLKIVGKNYLI